MVQILPQVVPPSSSSSTNNKNTQRETYTLWMKSLVYKNGCTVFDSKGEIVYRVDNYDKKCRSEVYLMDLKGTVLYILRRKRIKAFGRWDGYKCIEDNVQINVNKEKPYFRVVKTYCTCFKGSFDCQVNAGCEKYQILKLARSKAFRITDITGNIVAEVTRKQTSSGIVLGDDVLTLAVEACVDHSFIMALVTVYGLINHKL